jgi:hypothetical protein
MSWCAPVERTNSSSAGGVRKGFAQMVSAVMAFDCAAIEFDIRVVPEARQLRGEHGGGGERPSSPYVPSSHRRGALLPGQVEDDVGLGDAADQALGIQIVDDR